MNVWERRIERALVLEREYPAATELLEFYRQIAGFQKKMGTLTGQARAVPHVPAQLPESLQPHMVPLLLMLQHSAPEPLAGVARNLLYTDDWDPADPAPNFILRVLMQPYLEQLASRTRFDKPVSAPICPFCEEHPLASVLRPEGEGGKRSLICSLCFTEWDFRRLLCPKCGEENHQKLPVFTAGQFPHVRIEACDTCRTYIKSIDMTRNGLALPEVDELASLPLDLWAGQNGYTKLQPNLFGL
ncbi:MAG TPA: formate dehydrogenase accessory protein FdhE [Bryobacteraceae bacterium]|jgi:FdhE protein